VQKALPFDVARASNNANWNLMMINACQEVESMHSTPTPDAVCASTVYDGVGNRRQEYCKAPWQMRPCGKSAAELEV